MKNIFKGIKGGLAGLVLTGSLALGGCAESCFEAIPGQCQSEPSYAPLQPGVTFSIVKLGIEGGPIKIVSVNENGKWIGERTSDFHWKGHKFGEAYFKFPSGSTELGFYQAEDELKRETVAITYTIGKKYCQNWRISRIPYGVSPTGIYIDKGNGRWGKDVDSNHPTVEVFYVEKDNTLKPIDKNKR